MTANDRPILKEIVGINFTNVERALIRLMSDGKGYTIDELKEYDKEAEDKTVQMHLHNIRKKIVGSCYRVHSEIERGILTYRITRILIL